MENRTIAKEAEKNHVTEKDRDREKDLGRNGQDPENALDLESGPDHESGQKDQSAAAAEIEKRGHDHVIARKVHPKVQDPSDLVLDRKGQKGQSQKKEGKNQSQLRKIREGRLRHLLQRKIRH